MEIDFERLRQDLMDYYGTAMTGGFPMAVIDLSNVEKATDEELIELANQAGINAGKYVI